MLRPFTWCIIFLLGLTSQACRRDPLDVDISQIDYEARIERFDEKIFNLDLNEPERGIDELYQEYGEFFDIFNVYIINIGPASARLYPSFLSMFVNDPTNREVFEYTERIFSSPEQVEDMLSNGMKHYLYHYPDSVPPRVVGYVSRFNQGLFTVGNFIGIGLDQYLGKDCPYYRELGIPQYLAKNKYPGRIAVDAMSAWASQIYPYNDSVDNVLNRMIHQGMLAYFVDAMFPGLEEHTRMGFTEDQMKWCRNNEKQMWTYLVEHKLLFSSDPLVIRKLTDLAPHTAYFTSESPGRAAVWQGLQIFRAFVKRNPGLSLDQLLSIRDYQMVLRGSRYDP